MSRSHHRRREKGPGLFSDIGKEARGLLNKGYHCNQQFNISTYSDTGVTLTSNIAKRQGKSSGFVAAQYKHNNTTIDVNLNPCFNTLTSNIAKRQGKSSGFVAAQYKHNNTTISVNVNSRFNISATLTFKGILPCTNIIASYQLPKYHELVVQQFYKHAAFVMSLAVQQSPTVKFSATVGTPNIAFGVEGKYKTASSLFMEYNAAISVKKQNMDVSISLVDKGDLLNASYIRYLDWPKKIAAIVDVTRRLSTNKNTFTVGGSCVVDHLTVVKAKLNNHRILQTSFEHKFRPKSYLTISGEFDTNALDKTPRIGLSLALTL